MTRYRSRPVWSACFFVALVQTVAAEPSTPRGPTARDSVRAHAGRTASRPPATSKPHPSYLQKAKRPTPSSHHNWHHH